MIITNRNRLASSAVLGRMKPLFWIAVLLQGLSLLGCSHASPGNSTYTPAGATAIVATPSTIQAPLPTVATIATATPVPLGVESTAMSTIGPTHTPRPTQTSLPAPTAVLPTLSTPIQQITAGQTLPINHDLLFINGGELRLWQSQLSQVTMLLPAPDSDLIVSGWQVTPDRQSVLIAQTQSNGGPGFTLSLFNAETRQIEERWAETEHYLFAYALAVDGRSLAYITSTTSSQAGQGVEVIQLIGDGQDKPSKLADCPNSHSFGSGDNSFIYTTRCQNLVAGADGRTWLWRDIEGVWQGSLEQSPRLLVAHEYDENDPPRIYSATTDWSPDGRYQLLSAHRSEGSNRWVLDMTSGQLIEVPNSTTGLQDVAYWQWIEDNRLFTVRPPVTINGETDNVAELWRIAGAELVLDASLMLPDSAGIPPTAPVQVSDGRLAFIHNESNDANVTVPMLYLITEFDQSTQPLIQLPPLRGHWSLAHNQSLTWAPDNSGVLYISPTAQMRQPFYIPVDDPMLYDLSQVWGNQITDLMWLP